MAAVIYISALFLVFGIVSIPLGIIEYFYI